MRLDVSVRRRVSAAFALDAAFELDLAPGRAVGALFGPSGCGKTTTLSTLAGLVRPDAGRIALDGAPVFDSAEGIDVAPERRAIGLVAQDGLLFPHLDVAGNLAFGARLRRGRPAPERERVLDVLRLGALLARDVATLSGGERQRVALARALLAGPRLLLLDEPMSALDDVLRMQALALLGDVTDAFGVPALYVSHDRVEVARLASAVVRMDAGRVVETGPAARVLDTDDAPGPVPNLLPLVRVAGAPGLARLADRHDVLLPADGVPGSVVWARVSSGAVALELPGAAAAPSSPRNRLPGRVVALRTSALRVRVALDVGVPLHADVTPAAAAALALAPGLEVVAVVKTHALEVL